MKLAVIVFAVASLLACDKSVAATSAAVSKTATAATAPSDKVAALAELGFTVFTTPQTIPSFHLADLAGGKVNLDDFRGHYLLLNIWATWCPPCRAEMPSMETLYRELADEGLKLLAVSANEKLETVKDFLTENPYTFPVALDADGSLSAVLASRGIPTTYIIDGDGKAVAGIIGSRTWDDEATLRILRRIFAP